MEFEKQYLTFDEYKELGGKVLEMPFKLLEFQARKQIDKYTFGRLIDLKKQNQETKLCVYELINFLDSYSKSQNHDKSISSESTDGYSVSYSSISESALKSKINEIQDIIKTYLINCTLEDGTPYLYRGVK